MNLLFALIFMPLVFLIGMDMPAYLNEPPIIQNVQQGSYAQRAGRLDHDLYFVKEITYGLDNCFFRNRAEIIN